MYNCKNSKAQGYECQVHCKPNWQDKHISFDVCLGAELMYLWNLGIITTGCCCGEHWDCQEYDMSFIGVRFEDIDKMKELGYKVRFNSCRPDDEDSFIPKTRFS